jgi:branched-chain amino acid transport system permease protein
MRWARRSAWNAAVARTTRVPPLTHTLTDVVLLGSVYALLAFGISVKRGATGTLDFSHVAVFAVGAVAAIAAMRRGSYWEALGAGTLAGAFAGAAVDRLALWPIRVAAHRALGANAPIVATAAAMTLMFSFAGGAAGAAWRPLGSGLARLAIWNVFEAPVRMIPLVAAAACVIALVVGVVVVYGGGLGLGLRAVASNENAARAAGVGVESLIGAWTFLASALGAFGGLVFDSIAGAIAGGYIVAILQIAVFGGLPSAPERAAALAAVAVLTAVIRPHGWNIGRALRPPAPS